MIPEKNLVNHTNILLLTTNPAGNKHDHDFYLCNHGYINKTSNNENTVLQKQIQNLFKFKF